MKPRSWAGLLLIVGCAVGTLGSNCGTTEDVTIPDPVPPAVEAPAPQAVTPTEVSGGPVGHTWTEHGVTITIVADEWGPGSCHKLDRYSCRTFKLENNSGGPIHSRGAVFDGPSQGCGAWGPGKGGSKKGPTEGPHEIQNGQTAEVKYCWEPRRKTCRSQWDDAWGPEGISIVHDVFDAGNDSCKKCVEDPTETSSTECGKWNECHEHPQASSGNGKVCKQEKECVETKTIDYLCKPDVTTTREWEETKDCDCECEWRGKFCVTYLSNSGDEYRILDDGQVWKSGLSLSRGNQNTCWSHSIDNSNLCLWWKGEKIGCDRASCAEAEANWHGSVRFRCECVY